ncbi:MAG: flagellar basal body rod protein FlgB [Alphaproteobacteria bacterium]|nr:flagellar basal body rod protein FlgB [Alphaproteobacteria bacterium]
MNIQDVKVVQMMTDRMKWLSQRQRVLAENVANSDTPNYVAKDMKKVDFEKIASARHFQMELATTHSSHYSASRLHSQMGAVQENQTPVETSPTGNSVVIEEELIKVADTVVQYQLMTSLYKKQLGMYRMALGNR